MNRGTGKIRNLHVEGIPANLFFQFKMDVLKKKITIREAIIFLMEAYVKTDNPGDDVEKKTDNPGDDSRSSEEVLVDKIIEARKAQEDLKKPEEEPVDESLEVRVVEKPVEIHTVKKPEEKPEEEPGEKPEIESEEEPEEEPAAENNPGPESELEKEPVDENNPGPEEEKKTGFLGFLERILPPWF